MVTMDAKLRISETAGLLGVISEARVKYLYTTNTSRHLLTSWKLLKIGPVLIVWTLLMPYIRKCVKSGRWTGSRRGDTQTHCQGRVALGRCQPPLYSLTTYCLLRRALLCYLVPLFPINPLTQSLAICFTVFFSFSWNSLVKPLA